MARSYCIIEKIIGKNDAKFVQSLFQNDQIIYQQLKELIDQNLSLIESQYSLESSNENIPKLLHWFEWGKNKLIIYDIAKNKTNEIQLLDVDFKVPAFSRSIMLKDGRIYLMGGEQPEYISRKDLYLYNLENNTFSKKQSMICKKYDFSICNILNHIYIICGKDQQATISDTCERYDCDTDQWVSISKVSISRYAATAVAFQNQYIFLFGGRGNQNHEMISLIEQYHVKTNIWTNVVLKTNEQFWHPVEVCAGIQISQTQILIFGGSEQQLQDSCNVLTFEVCEKKLTKRQDLVKSHIFVQQPFLYGKYVYGIGNEYYIKQRNIHKYDIINDSWDIVF